MIIMIILNKDGSTTNRKIDPLLYFTWKEHFQKNKLKTDKYLDLEKPVLLEDEYLNYLNFYQDVLIEDLLK